MARKPGGIGIVALVVRKTVVVFFRGNNHGHSRGPVSFGGCGIIVDLSVLGQQLADILFRHVGHELSLYRLAHLGLGLRGWIDAVLLIIYIDLFDAIGGALYR